MVGLLNRHLDDAGFAEVWVARSMSEAPGAVSSAEAHLTACGECQTRFAAFTGWLDEVRSDAHADAEEALGVERLSSQQATIMRRLEAAEGPARVIAFPGFARNTARRATGRTRWIVGSAAAGLAVGLALGELMNHAPASPLTAPEVAASSSGQLARGMVPGTDMRLGPQPASHVSDEVFFSEPDLTASQVRVPESLQYLNLITPGARDYDSR